MESKIKTRIFTSLSLASIFLILPLFETSAAHLPDEEEILLSTISQSYRSRVTKMLGVNRITDLNRFDISVKLNPDRNELEGLVDMSIRNTSSVTLNDIILRLWPNTMGESGRRMEIVSARAGNTDVRFSHLSDSTVRVALPSAVRPGDKIQIKINFAAAIPVISGDNLNMFALEVEQMFKMLSGSKSKPASSDYGVFATDGKVWNLGGFYPVPGNLGPSGWDVEGGNGIGDFSFGPPANYFVLIKVPADFKVISTGRTISRETSGGYVMHFVVAGASRDFVIEAGKKYETIKTNVDGTEVTAHYLTGDSKSGKHMMDVARDSFLFFNKKFGPYPYTEFKVVEAPITGGAGGVEFPGLVTIAEMLVHQPDKSSKTGEMDFFSLAFSSSVLADLLDFVVAHETAHQWWSSLVGSDPIKYPYVDESMASYSAVLYFEDIFGKEKGKSFLDTQVRMNYQIMRLFGGKDRPVITPASDYDSMIDYTGIVYGKAPLYHYALRNLLGSKAYYDVCAEYTKRYAFKIAGPQSFLETAVALNPSLRGRLEELYRHWMKEKNGDRDIGTPDLNSILEMVSGHKFDGSNKEFMEEMFPMMKQYR